MTLDMKYKEGYRPGPAQIMADLLPALGSIPVRSPNQTRQMDDGVAYHVLGVMTFRDLDYNILLSEKGIARAEAKIHTLFDVMGTDHIDGYIRFLRPGKESVPGSSIPIANLAFEPDLTTTAFLRGLAQRFKTNMPRIETLALSLCPNRSEGWVSEII